MTSTVCISNISIYLFILVFVSISIYVCGIRILTVLANLLLQNTVERIFTGDTYGEIDRGVLLVRGENVVLVGEIVRREHFYFDWNIKHLVFHKIYIYIYIYIKYKKTNISKQDLEKEDDIIQTKLDVDVVLEEYNAEIDLRKKRERIRNKKLHALGFSVIDAMHEDANLY